MFKFGNPIIFIGGGEQQAPGHSEIRLEFSTVPAEVASKCFII